MSSLAIVEKRPAPFVGGGGGCAGGVLLHLLDWHRRLARKRRLFSPRRLLPTSLRSSPRRLRPRLRPRILLPRLACPPPQPPPVSPLRAWASSRASWVSSRGPPLAPSARPGGAEAAEAEEGGGGITDAAGRRARRGPGVASEPASAAAIACGKEPSRRRPAGEEPEAEPTRACRGDQAVGA